MHMQFEAFEAPLQIGRFRSKTKQDAHTVHTIPTTYTEIARLLQLAVHESWASSHTGQYHSDTQYSVMPTWLRHCACSPHDLLVQHLTMQGEVCNR